jgi:imidazolonepropionase-like amidohydrolase
MMSVRFRIVASIALFLCYFQGHAAGQARDGLQPTVFAIRGARIVSEPGKVLENATVVVREGTIEAVGADAKVPPDALVIEGKGLTVYAGFIDALSTWGFDQAQRRSAIGMPTSEDFASEALAATQSDNRKGMTPEFVVSMSLSNDNDKADAWRKLGFTAHLIAPEGGFIVGQSALVSLSGAPSREAILRSPVAMHAAFRLMPGAEYPRALMGIVAHCRQTLLDAGHYQRLWAAYEKGGRVGRPPVLDPSWAALGQALDGKMPVVLEADSKDEIHRALDFAKEFHLQPIIFGGRDAWKAAERLKAEAVPVLLRMNFTEQQAGRFGRMRRGPAPTPATPPESDAEAAKEAEKNLPDRVRADRDRQKKEELRNAGVLNKHGVRFAFCGQGLDKPEKFIENLRKVIAEGLAPADALRALTIDAAQILGADRQLGSIAPGKAAHLVVTEGDFQDSKSSFRYVFSDGVRFEYPKPVASATPKPDESKPKADQSKQPPSAKSASAAKREKPHQAAAKNTEQATELESDRKPKLHTGGNVLIRGANVLTVTKPGSQKTDLLIRGGKIAEIGAGLKAPAGFAVIEAEGMYVMPGIIDTHSHFAVAGGVNEFSLSVVPEVRVKDVIDSEDVQIYRALAGGVTTARLLHGSANVIGGQDAVIKLKYGKSAKELVIVDAPRGVKFALGENVKRTDGRFPNTRLGVEAVLIRAFTEAQAYRRTWEEYERARADGRPVVEPRRDLRLEALVDVLKGDLKVHCHCYRADEILMLLRVADRFGFKIKSLQHVLEGYKIAPEIAEHGASCSTFSDWWAYKIEAYDAIPFNSALLHEAGVSVCLKSDSNELMRHLYQEAAKCLKYGGMSEAAALETITLNAAKQLGLEKRVGTIEVGKDADLAIFNAHPLDSEACVDMTIVEGEVYFQRSEKLKAIAAAQPLVTAPSNHARPIPRDPHGNYVIIGATVHPVSGPPIPNGVVTIQNNKITAVTAGNGGGANGAIKNGATVIDAVGLHVFPGMIDAGTVLGLTELDSARETNDFAEGGDFQPDLRASIAINPDSELIPVTRANGVTTVVTRPIGSVIAGQSALINLAGWVPREMAVVDPLALHVEFPSSSPLFSFDPAAPRIGRAIARKQKEEKVRRLKELFRQAIAYDDARKQDARTRGNPRLEALVPYARGIKPVVIQANRKQDIIEALELGDQLKLKVVLSGAIDAWKVTEELKKRKVPVIIGPVMAMPAESYDPYDAPFACAARLAKAGIEFCIRSGGSSNTRNLPYEAAMAVSYGLPPEEGLKAVTLYPAQILGVADQLGSIEPGKRANLVLADGDILQASTHVQAIFIDGRPLEPVSKQTRLYDRYRERLKEVKDGLAPLGTK